MKKTPKLRFKGFEGEWEEKKLGDFFTKVTTKNTKLKYTTVLTNSAELGIIPQSDYFTFEVANNNSIGNYYIVQPDDFVYNPRVSVTAPVGPIKRNKLGFTGIMSPLYLVFKITNISKDFLCYYYETSNWHQFMRLSGNSGARFDRISMSDDTFVQMPIMTPSLPEQQRIASYFTHLDTLIEASRKKVEKYKQVKAASLQALFPQHGERVPKLRFKGYEGEWKKVELGEIGTFLKGQGYSKADITDKGTPLFLYGRLYTNYSFVTTSVDTFANKQEGSVISEGNEIIIPASGETAEDIVRASAILSKGIILGGDLNIIRIDTNIYDPAFVALSISYGSTHNELSKSAQGKTVVHLHNSEIKKGVIKIPSLQEQHLIAQYFTNLDSLLTLEQLRYEKLQQVKRASLSQMFA